MKSFAQPLTNEQIPTSIPDLALTPVTMPTAGLTYMMHEDYIASPTDSVASMLLRRMLKQQDFSASNQLTIPEMCIGPTNMATAQIVGNTALAYGADVAIVDLRQASSLMQDASQLFSGLIMNSFGCVLLAEEDKHLQAADKALDATIVKRIVSVLEQPTLTVGGDRLTAINAHSTQALEFAGVYCEQMIHKATGSCGYAPVPK